MTGKIEFTTPLSFLKETPREEGKSLWEYYQEMDSPQLPVVCSFNGEPLLRKHWDIIPQDSDEVHFIVLPQGDFLDILRIVALVALSIVAPVIAGSLAPFVGITTELGISLLTAGIVLAGSFLINALLPPQIPDYQDREVSPTYNLTAQGNSARLLSPIPKLYGRHNLYPDFASQPWITYQDNDQYLYQLFSLGVGEYDIEEVRIEDTTLWTSASGFSDSFSDVELEIYNPGERITLFPTAVITSVEVGGQELETTDWIGPFTANPADTVATRLHLDFVFPRGVYVSTDRGDLINHSFTIFIEIRTIDNLGNATSGYRRIETFVISANSATPLRRTRFFRVERGRYQVRVRRTTPRNDDVKYADQVIWSSLRAFIPDDAIFSDTTIMAVKMKATNQLSEQSSRRFNTIQTAKIPIRSLTGWSEPTATQSIAWAAADILRNPIYGANIEDSRIDTDSLLRLDAIFNVRGDTFNGVFDRRQSLWQTLTQVLQAGRVQPIIIGGKISFVRDEPAALVKGVFTPRNIVRETFETSHILYDEESPDSVIVEFIDESTWRQNEILCSVPGSTERNPARIQLFGVTNRSQAWREGIYQAASNLYRRIFATLSTELEGRLLIRGDAALVSHDLVEWGNYGEVFAFTRNNVRGVLTVRVQGEHPQARPQVIGFNDQKGKLWGPIRVISRVRRSATDHVYGLNYQDVLDTEESQGPLVLNRIRDADREPTRAVFGTTENYSRRFKVVSSTPDRSGTVQLVFVNDDPRVYEADRGSAPEGVIPAGPGISTGPPHVENIYISTRYRSATRTLTGIVSWSVAPGATSYVLEISENNRDWGVLYDGPETQISFEITTNTVYLRVLPVGRLRGTYTNLISPLVTGVDGGAPTIPLDLLVIVEGFVLVKWDGSQRANSYRIDFLLTDNQGNFTNEVYTETVSDSSLVVVREISEQIITDSGGPWSNFRVAVTPLNLIGSGPTAFYTVDSARVNEVRDINYEEYNGNGLTVSWEGPSDAESFELFVGRHQQGEASQPTIFATTMDTTHSFPYATFTANGGPWREIEVGIRARRGSIVGDTTFEIVRDEAPSAPSNVTVDFLDFNFVSFTQARIQVSWAAVAAPDFVEYRVFRGMSSSNEVYRGTATSVILTVAHNRTYSFRVETIDDFIAPEGPNLTYNSSPLVFIDVPLNPDGGP